MASSDTTIKTVDIVPEFGISGDFKKISEYDFAAFNAKVLPVITLLLMEEGSNQLFPHMGLRTTLVKIPYSTKQEVTALLNEVQMQLDKYSRVSTSVHIDEEKTDWIEGDLVIGIEISGVPGTLSIGVNKKSSNQMQPFNISHPSIFNK